VALVAVVVECLEVSLSEVEVEENSGFSEIIIAVYPCWRILFILLV